MPEPFIPVGRVPPQPHLPLTAGLDGMRYRTAAEAALEPASPGAHRVGWGFISLFTLAFIGTNLVFLAPLLVRDVADLHLVRARVPDRRGADEFQGELTPSARTD